MHATNWKLSCVVLAAACAIYCGGKSSGSSQPVADSTKTAASRDAAAAVRTSNDTTRAASQLATRAQVLGSMVQAHDVTGFDISGLPPPASLGVPPAPAPTPAPATRRGIRPYAGLATGCVVADTSSGAAKARYLSTGEAGCNSPAGVQVTYLNGDQVEYSITQTNTGFEVTMTVTRGNWAGTRLHWLIDASSDRTDLTWQTDGTMMYASDGKARISEDFNSRFHLQQSGNSSTAVTFSFSGDATDNIGLRKVTSDFTVQITGGGGGNSGSFSESWTGGARIATLVKQGAGLVEQGSVVEWRNLHVSLDAVSSPNGATFSWLGSGEVLYGGQVVGELEVAKSGNYNGQLQIRWSDGVTTPFDFSQLIIAI